MARAAKIIEQDGGLDALINNAGNAPEWRESDTVIGVAYLASKSASTW